MQPIQHRQFVDQREVWSAKVTTSGWADVLEVNGEWDRDRIVAFGNPGTSTVEVRIREAVDGRAVRESRYTLPPGGHDFARVVGAVTVAGRVVHESSPGSNGDVWAHVTQLGAAELAGNVDALVSLLGAGPAGPYLHVGWTPARRHWLTVYVGGALDLALVRADGVPWVVWSVTTPGPIGPALVCPPSLALYARNPGVGTTVNIAAAWAV